MNDYKRFAIPMFISYKVDRSFSNEKLIKLRIDVCHEGENKNRSEIPFDALEKARDTIANIPLLAFVVKNANGEYDFAEHNMDVGTDDDGNVQITYLEQPIGFIPKENNYSYIEKDGKRYVQVDGYIWKAYSNVAEKIVNERQTFDVSMEITATDYEKNDKGILVINDFIYTGVTLLGENVEPGMYNSTAKVQKFTAEREDEFKVLKDEMNNALSAGNNEVVEPAVEPIVEPVVDVQPEEYVVSFKLSNEKKADKLFKALVERYKAQGLSMWYDYYAAIVETYDTHIVYYITLENGESHYYNLGYVEQNDEVSLDENGVEVFIQFLTKEEVSKLSELKSKYAQYEIEIVELRTYKETREKQDECIKKDALLEEYIELLDKDVIETFRQNKEQYSYDKLDVELAKAFAEKERIKFRKAKSKVVTMAIGNEVQETLEPAINKFYIK